MPESWSPSVTGELRQRVLELSKTVAGRFCQAEKIQPSLFAPFSAASLGHGYSGIALALFYLGQLFPEQRWMTAAHTYLRLAAQATQEQAFPGAALFSGSSGLALVLSQFARQDSHYQPVCQTVTQALARSISEKPWPRRNSGVAQNEYDTINGAAGITGCLLSLEQTDARISEARDSALQYLLWLAGEDKERGRKHWFISPELGSKIYREKYPAGYVNLGLAHGIPGPLAALALAWTAGYRLPGMRAAIETLAAWIVEQRVSDSWGINWPEAVSLGRQTARPQGAFAGWCYGAPGIARALWLAGEALEDAALRELAIESIEAVLRRPIAVRKVCSPTICHGLSGLLLICLHFARESQNALISQHIPLLVQQIVNLFHPDFRWGFRDEAWDGTYTDDPGFVRGAVGVVLALLAAATSLPPSWDRAFLLA